MAEGSEIHIDENDPYGKKIGLLAAILAVMLSVFTISAHRAHTETIELQNETNDLWSHYQSKRIREYQTELNQELVTVVAPPSPEKTKLIDEYTKQNAKYKTDLDEIKNDADTSAARNVTVQKKALHYDFAEGILEISLIMTSLYFISRKKLFPIFGMLFGLIGTVIGVLGLML